MAFLSGVHFLTFTIMNYVETLKAAWLKSPEFRAEVGTDLVILVMHG
jgi:hypothetical protein